MSKRNKNWASLDLKYFKERQIEFFCSCFLCMKIFPSRALRLCWDWNIIILQEIGWSNLLFFAVFNGLKFIRTFYVTSWDTVSCFMMLEYQSQRKARKHDIINEILPMKNWDKMNHMFIIKKIDQKIRKRIDRVII